ncbi:MAG: phenylalanine--tRNA ligase subunit alpha [Methanobacteriota archaeon]
MTDDLSDNEKRVLVALGGARGNVPPDELASASNLSKQEAVSAANWLKAKGHIESDDKVAPFWSLGKEGKAAVEKGLPERRILRAMASRDRASTDELVVQGAVERGEIGIALGWLKKKGLGTVEKQGKDTVVALTPAARSDAARETADERVLALLASGEAPEDRLPADGLALLKGRGDLVRRREEVVRSYRMRPKGAALLAQGLSFEESISQLTPEVIASREWEGKPLRRYDVRAAAPAVYAGKRHPLRQIIEEIRLVFLEMGFSEIKGPFVETAFWNMDALFVPQDHPAREMQDTFYLSDPPKADLSKEPLVRTIKDVHERGGDTGSRGWGSAWRREEAERLLLRTHTTVDTIQHLAKHPKETARVFSVDRVFRKEALDATHLPEFHQVEGIVHEEGADFRMLVGILTEFYRKMGFADVRIRPSFFPYTEPSAEVEVLTSAGRWLELGGCGIFRPEVTKPLGVPHPVLAWGLGLERLAMMRLGLKDIRDLYVSDIDWLRRQPLL